MDNQQQKFDYLNEHLPYMQAQARYDYSKLKQPLPFRDWNASFQSFAVNARNLVGFLTNGDKHNFKASDFIPEFRNRKRDIQGPMTKLDAQVFHLAKARPKVNDKKFGLEAASEVFAWIEQGMNEFVTGLSPDDKKAWNCKKADPTFDDDAGPSTGPTGPASPQSASSSIFSSTTHTTSVTPEFTLVPDGAAIVKAAVETAVNLPYNFFDVAART